MALPISPGEILELTQIIIKTYKKFRYASDEMDQLGRKVRVVGALMKGLDSPDNQIEYLQKNPNGRELAKCLDEELVLTKETLEQVEEITLLWKKAQVSYKAHRRAVFVLWTMREIPGICSALDLQMERIQMIRKQANEAGVKLGEAAIESLIQALHKKGFIVNKTHGKAGETSKRAGDALKDSGVDSRDDPQARMTKEQKLKQVLKQQGFSDNEVQKMIDLYKLELERKPNRKPAVSPSPEPANKIDTTAKSTYPPKILVIGGRYGAFATAAHAYLELVRAWTANLGGPWVFARADWASLMVDTGFRRGPGKLADNEELIPGGGSNNPWILEALFKDKKYFQTDDYPNEKQSILERVKAHRRRGIREDDFTQYDYIICSGEWARTKLEKLSELAQTEHPSEPNKSKILNIAKPGATTENQSAEDIIKGARNAVKDFLGNRLSWTRPAGPIAKGSNRTVFFHIKDRKQRDALLSKHCEGLKRLESNTKCKIWIAWEIKGLGWLVAVVGPRDVLKEAQGSILKFVASSK